MLISFGQLLKQHRLQRGLTQTELSRAIGVTPSYITRLEYGERHPSRRVVLALAKALALPPAERDQLLASALHLPEGSLERLVEAGGVNLTHPVIQAVTTALQDPTLNHTQREILATEVTSYITFRLQKLKAEARQQRLQQAILEHA